MRFSHRRVRRHRPCPKDGLGGPTSQVARGCRSGHRAVKKPQLPASLRLIQDLRKESLFVVPLATSEAARLKMPVGHPRPNVLYIGDPVEAPRYYPAADFHRRVFEHKFAEAMRLVMGLGATEVRVRWEKGWRGELVGDLQAPIQKLLGAGKLRASAEKKSSLLFEAAPRATGASGARESRLVPL